jgi:hypothetical protein
MAIGGPRAPRRLLTVAMILQPMPRATVVSAIGRACNNYGLIGSVFEPRIRAWERARSSRYCGHPRSMMVVLGDVAASTLICCWVLSSCEIVSKDFSVPFE